MFQRVCKGAFGDHSKRYFRFATKDYSSADIGRRHLHAMARTGWGGVTSGDNGAAGNVLLRLQDAFESVDKFDFS